MLTSEVIRFRANAHIRLNGCDYELAGAGDIISEKGIVRGHYAHDVPADQVDALIFQTVLVTGYPSVCRAEPGFVNPFQQSDYQYRREIEFGRHGHLAYDAVCWHVDEADGRCLESEFWVEGTLAMPGLLPAKRVVEKWNPSGTEIVSEFEIIWPACQSPDRIIGSASTVYRPSSSAAAMQAPAHRSIVFPVAESSPGHLTIVQESWVEADSPQ